MTTAIMKKQDSFEGKATLAQRVSELFKADGNSSSPLLLQHTSMQKLRYCCQNLNVFPILLCSFASSETKLMDQKSLSMVNMDFLLTRITERIYRMYSSIRYTIIKRLGTESMSPKGIAIVTKKNPKPVAVLPDRVRAKAKLANDSRASDRKFEKFAKQRSTKSNPLFLKLAVYLAPLFLGLQLVGIFSLMILGKYTPGFVFLFTALIFLGCISMKVLNHDISAVHTYKREKRKIE